MEEKRTDRFTETELRLMLLSFKKSELKALVKEFDAALDERIRHKLGLDKEQTSRPPTE